MYDVYIILEDNCIKYVGVTIASKGYLKRFREHCNAKDNHLLHSRMREIGLQHFAVKRILKNIPDNKAEYYEKLWISKFHTFYKENGYNMTRGGHGVVGIQISDKTKAKIGNTSKAVWQKLKSDPQKLLERNAKVSAGLKGRKFSISHKQKLSIAASKRCGSKNPFYGKSHTKETKDLISKINSVQVCMIDPVTNQIIRIFDSLVLATAYLIENNITKNTGASSRISKICRGIDKTAYGYKWRFYKSVTTIPDGSRVDNITTRSASTLEKE